MPDEESLSGATITGTTLKSSAITPKPAGVVTDTEPQHVEGYQKLADFMSDYPAGACFRQFGSLNALNLLYYQAELCLLEQQLKTIAKEDRISEDKFRRLYFQSHQWLSEGKAEGSNLEAGARTQWNLIVRIREVLKLYNDALLVQSQLRRLPRPRDETLQYIRDWTTDDGNGEYIFLLGQDKDLYFDINSQDMMAIYTREYEDDISTWLTERALFWWNKFMGHRFQKKHNGTWMASSSVYSRKPVIHLVTFLSIAIASTVPIVSVSVLNTIESTKMKLGLMAIFTVIFCLLFGLFSGAKKTELLAASAAFAAVQVVFISGNDCCQAS